MVHALNARNGETVWTYATGNKIFSAPFITSQLVVVTSCDGFIHALDKKQGSARWKFNTDYPIVACPTVANGNVYTGSSNGKFYSIRLANGTLNWVTDGLNGYIESRPAIDHERIYIGTWGAMFYAIDGKPGKKYGNSTPNAEDTSLREPAGPQCCPTGRMEKHQNRS